MDSMQSFERVRTAAELRHNHFTYDVTALGERVEQFFDDLAGMVDAVGNLDANRLARIRTLFGELAEAVERRDLDPAPAECLHRAAGAVRGPARRRLAVHARARSHDGLHGGHRRGRVRRLQAQGRRLPERLLARARPARRRDRRPGRAAARRPRGRGADARGADLGRPAPAALRARGPRAPARPAAAPVDGARGLVRRGGLAAALARRPPARGDRLDPARRPAARERRVQRVNRSSEYRALAKLFADAPDERACHAIHAAAFGLYGARHLAVPELDADLVSPGESWWDAPFAPVQGYLRRPGTGETAAGRPARSPTARSPSCSRSRRSCAAARSSTSCWTGCPGGDAAVRAPALDEQSFDLLLDAIGQALTGGTIGYSDDGTLQLEVVDMGEDLPGRGAQRRRRRRAREPGPAGESGARVIEARARAACAPRPLLPAGDPAFGAVRANAERLRAEFQRELGYELVVRASHARLRKRSDALRTDRPARIPRCRAPRHVAALHAPPLRPVRARPRRVRARAGADEHRPAGRGGALARRRGGHRARPRQPRRPPLPGRRLPLPETLGVLVAVAGQAESWVRSRTEGDDESALRRHALGAR